MRDARFEEGSTPRTRWELEQTGERWQAYADRWAREHAEGVDLSGESRFVDALAPRGATVLDAGCGTGRVAAGLVAVGHRAVGVDKDHGLIAIARGRYPGVEFLEADLLGLNARSLEDAGLPAVFDVIVAAGNVFVYLAPGTEGRVLAVLRDLLKPGGRVVTGFATDREYRIDHLDADAVAAGLVVDYRFATWHLDPYRPDSDWAVTVMRAPGNVRR